MLTYTVSSRQLADADIYVIREVSALSDFLKEHYSLCIVKTPFAGSIVEMTRVEGKNFSGEPVHIYSGCCSEKNLGYLKNQLDRRLQSDYLFISWKQKGYHTFKLVRGRQTLAEFPDFSSALAAYFPDGFVPEKSYSRAFSVFSLMCKAMRRRALLGNLVTLLERKRAGLAGESL